MLILLYSDTNYVLEGFKAEFFVSNCPNNCSMQGKCVGHQCVCQGDWIGKDCSIHACPDDCGVAKGHGQCSKEHCRCINVSFEIHTLSSAKIVVFLGLFRKVM